MHILVVEDDPDLGEIICLTLGDLGHTTKLVDSGEEALAHVRDPVFGLMIIDLGLPGFNGLEVVKSLRSSGNKIPTMAMSGTTDTVVITKFLTAGADDFIAKPFHSSELHARCDAIVRRCELLIVKFEGFSFDYARRAIVIGGAGTFFLTAQQSNFLNCLIAADGAALSYQDLVDASGTFRSNKKPAVNIAHTIACNLNKKLEFLTGDSECAETSRGFGYRLGLKVLG